MSCPFKAMKQDAEALRTSRAETGNNIGNNDGTNNGQPNGQQQGQTDLHNGSESRNNAPSGIPNDFSHPVTFDLGAPVLGPKHKKSEDEDSGLGSHMNPSSNKLSGGHDVMHNPSTSSASSLFPHQHNEHAGSASTSSKVTFAPDVPVLDKSQRPVGPQTYITLEQGPVLKPQGGVGGGGIEDSISEPSNYGSGEGSPRLRKTSNISTTSSVGSEGDLSDLAPDRKVDLNSLIEGVGTLIIPAVSIMFIFFLL